MLYLWIISSCIKKLYFIVCIVLLSSSRNIFSAKNISIKTEKCCKINSSSNGSIVRHMSKCYYYFLHLNVIVRLVISNKSICAENSSTHACSKIYLNTICIGNKKFKLAEHDKTCFHTHSYTHANILIYTHFT